MGKSMAEPLREGRTDSGEDGEIAEADALIAFVSPFPCALSGLEIRGAEGAAFEASDRVAIGMDLTNSVFVAPANRTLIKSFPITTPRARGAVCTRFRLWVVPRLFDEIVEPLRRQWG